MTPEELREAEIDVVVLQRPHEVDLVERWTGRRVGTDLPALYLEHNAPTEHAVRSEHPVLRDPRLHDVPVVHVTAFNAMAWDCGGRPTISWSTASPTRVRATAAPTPPSRWSSTSRSDGGVSRAATSCSTWPAASRCPSTASVRTSSVRSRRSAPFPDWTAAGATASCSTELHEAMARHRVYFHPYRWTSLGLSLIEAMTIGMPVLALSTTEAPEAVPPGAGLVTNDLARLRATARHLLADPEEARARGEVARSHALNRFSLTRFLVDWDQVLKEVAA